MLDFFVCSQCKKNVELWAHPPLLTPMPSQANHSSPHIAVGSRRGETSEKLAHMFWLLGPCLGPLQRNLHTCGTPWSALRNSNDRRIKKKHSVSGLSLSGSLELVVRTWKHEHTTRWTQCRTRRCDNEQWWQLQQTVAVRSYTTRRQRIAQTATMDHGRHRPATETPTRTKSARQRNRLEIHAP